MEDPVAVVDVGSGAVKLLITDRAGLAPGGTPGFSTGTKTWLKAGPGDRMSDTALAATAEVFAAFRQDIDRLAPGAVTTGRVQVVATAVAREASNVADLAAITQAELGVDLDVLSGRREAELAFLGATSARSIDGPVVVLDIGAGSTEFAYRDDGSGDGPIHALSLPVGGRTLTDAYLTSDPYRAEELSAALSVMELHIDDLRRELPGIIDALEGTVIAGGAMTTIARVELGLTDPATSLDGQVCARDDIEDLFRTLATESAAERAHNPGLAPVHVDDVVGAMCVLVEFLRQCGVDQVMVSERGVRHGLAAEMLEQG